jgi:hypothetical protein
MTINQIEMATIIRIIAPIRTAIIKPPIVLGFTEDLIISALPKSTKDRMRTGIA